MENKQTALAKLKEVAMKYFNVTEIKSINFMDITTKDGNKISIEGDKLDIGVAVMVKDEAGETMPVPDGELILEDGSTITVKDGMVTAIVPASAEGEEVETEETKLSKLEQQIAKLNIAKEIAVHKDAIDTLKAEMKNFADLKAENETLTKALAEQKEFTKELFAFVEKIAELPSEESTIIKKDAFASTKKKINIEAEIKAVRASFADLHRNGLNNN